MAKDFDDFRSMVETDEEAKRVADAIASEFSELVMMTGISNENAWSAAVVAVMRQEIINLLEEYHEWVNS